MQDGRILALIRPYTNDDFGGDLVIIDGTGFVENTQPLLADAGAKGPAQTFATSYDVLTIPGPSPGGRFNSAVPLWDGTQRILVSWTQCRLLDTSVTPETIVPCTADGACQSARAISAPSIYSVWMFDPTQNTLLPIMPPTEGRDGDGRRRRAAAARCPRSSSTAYPASTLDQTWYDQGVGVIDIKSVYDFDGVDTATAQHSNSRKPGEDHRRAAPGALHPPGKGRFDPQPADAQSRRPGLRREPLHARDPRLRHG